LSADTIAALRHAEGLDRPFLVRYAQWLRAAAHGDLGRSIVYRAPIAPLVARRAVNSLALVAAALVVTWALVLPLGVWAAARDRSTDGRIVASGASALIAVPDLLIAIALVVAAARTYGARSASSMLART
jgi:peptide/nickel transport system permease protein